MAINWAEWKLPIVVAIVVVAMDLVLWVLLTVIGSGALNATGWVGYSQEAFSVLLGIWNFVHRPVTALLMPYLIEFMPSHGGGRSAILAEIAYVAACLLWVAGFARYHWSSIILAKVSDQIA